MAIAASQGTQLGGQVALTAGESNLSLMCQWETLCWLIRITGHCLTDDPDEEKARDVELPQPFLRFSCELRQLAEAMPGEVRPYALSFPPRSLTAGVSSSSSPALTSGGGGGTTLVAFDRTITNNVAMMMKLITFESNRLITALQRSYSGAQGTPSHHQTTQV